MALALSLNQRYHPAWLGSGRCGDAGDCGPADIVGRRAKLHTPQIFLRLSGGIRAFGLIGLFMGPMISS